MKFFEWHFSSEIFWVTFFEWNFWVKFFEWNATFPPFFFEKNLATFLQLYWQNSKTLNVRKLQIKKNQIINVEKRKNSKCDKTQDSKCEKTQIVTKLKNSKCNKAKKNCRSLVMVKIYLELQKKDKSWIYLSVLLSSHVKRYSVSCIYDLCFIDNFFVTIKFKLWQFFSCPEQL